MYVDFWFANTNDDEKQMTLEFLQNHDARDVTAARGEEFNEFRGRLYVDDDIDVVKLLDVALFYNDHSDDQRRLICGRVANLLRKSKLKARK